MRFAGAGAAEVSLLMCVIILIIKRQLLSFVKATVFFVFMLEYFNFSLDKYKYSILYNI